MVFKFIKNYKKPYSVKKMCHLFNVSRSGFYKFLKRPLSKREKENKKLLEKIQKIFILHKKRYGSPRVFKALIKAGIKVGKHRVARIMRNNNIFAKRRKKFRITTNSKHNYKVSPNLLNRNFTPTQKNKAWVSDLTYIYTKEGWLFLCMILDLFTKKVVGWAASSSLKVDIAISAIEMAVGREHPQPGLIFHSDRGIQYACNQFRKKLDEYKMSQSMSRKGNCWDNAPAESFFNTLKVELIYTKKYKSRTEAKDDVFEYIETYYNRLRLHSSLGYMTPREFDENHAA